MRLPLRLCLPLLGNPSSSGPRWLKSLRSTQWIKKIVCSNSHQEQVDRKWRVWRLVPPGTMHVSVAVWNPEAFNRISRDEWLSEIASLFDSRNFQRDQFWNKTHFLKRNSPAATAMGRCAEYTKWYTLSQSSADRTSSLLLSEAMQSKRT